MTKKCFLFLSLAPPECMVYKEVFAGGYRSDLIRINLILTESKRSLLNQKKSEQFNPAPKSFQFLSHEKSSD